MTAVSLFRLVNKYGRKMGKPELAPHDLRRTYAQLGYEVGVPITQISKLLGPCQLGDDATLFESGAGCGDDGQ